MEGYTPEDLAAAGLSQEEIAAMAEEAPAEGASADAEGQPVVPPVEAPEGEGGAPAQVAEPEVPPAAPIDPNVAPVPPEGDALPVPAEAPPIEGEKAPVTDKPAGPQPVDPFVAKMVGPQMTAEDYQAALADLKTKAQAGDIDMFEYSDRVADLKAEMAVAKFAQANNSSTGDQKWNYAQEAFKAVHPEYQNPVLWGALDGMVRQLAQDPEAQRLSDIGFLVLAHEKVQEALGLNKPKGDAHPDAPTTPSVTSTPQPPERAPALDRAKDKLPPSLGGLPAAQSSQPEDEFASLDKLTGLEQEAAVAAMERSDPAKFQRWLRGGATA
uniref:Uncharacterized protein n=1 Tax=Desulfovibrio sp. U5L TaxID=596152 RepID=I2Q031_9BACT